MTEHRPPRRTLWAHYRSLSLGSKILLYMVLGGSVGMALGERATVVQPLGDLFIRLLIMAAIPLVFVYLIKKSYREAAERDAEG